MMKYSDHKIKDMKITYIGGGSRGWAWVFMGDLAKEEALGGTVCLYDIDQEAARHNKVIGDALTARADTPGNPHGSKALDQNAELRQIPLRYFL